MVVIAIETAWLGTAPAPLRHLCCCHEEASSSRGLQPHGRGLEAEVVVVWLRFPAALLVVALRRRRTEVLDGVLEALPHGALLGRGFGLRGRLGEGVV